MNDLGDCVDELLLLLEIDVGEPHTLRRELSPSHEIPHGLKS